MDNENALVSVNSLITAKEQELEALRVAQDILSGGYHSDQNAIVQGIADGVDQKLPQEVAARTATLESEKATLAAAKIALEAQVADIPNQIAAATAPLEAAIAEKETLLAQKETLLAEKEARVVELEAAAQAVVNIDPIPADPAPAEEEAVK